MRLTYECPESFQMCIENLKCIAVAVPELEAIEVLVGVVYLNLGVEEVVWGADTMGHGGSTCPGHVPPTFTNGWARGHRAQNSRSCQLLRHIM